MPSRNPGALMQEKLAAVEELERKLLLRYLARAEYNVSLASANAGMLRSAFQRLIRRHALDVRRLREEAREKKLASGAVS